MYKQHFALKHYPFQRTPHVDELFEAVAQRVARARVRNLLDLRGIGLLTGEAGSGKTTVCRQVAAGLHTDLFRVRYVSLSTGSVLDTYNVIANEFGLPAFSGRATAYRAIRTEVSRMVAESKQLLVLVFDEAHHLRNEILEELRLLTNYRMDAEKRLCLLLVGLTELRRRLAMSAHESLAQRIVVRCHLGALRQDEVKAYLEHRLRIAGATVALFEPGAATRSCAPSSSNAPMRRSAPGTASSAASMKP